MTTRSLRLLHLPPGEQEAFAIAHKDAPLKRQVTRQTVRMFILCISI